MSAYIPIPKYFDQYKPKKLLSLENVQVTANQSIVNIKIDEDALIRIYIAISNFSQNPKIYITRDSTSGAKEFLNNADTLNNNSAYMFDILADINDNIAIFLDQDGTVTKLIVFKYPFAP